jgi:hypothetical protein
VTSPLQLAQWAYVFWRYLVSPGAGLYLLLIDPKLSGMSAWQVPIVCGLLLFPIASPSAIGSGDGKRRSAEPSEGNTEGQ